MKKIVLLLTLFIVGSISGQIKKIELDNDEINSLGTVIYSSNVSHNKFTNEEIQKYNLENTLAYLVEFVHENKVINKILLNINKIVYENGNTETTVKKKNYYPCFETSKITNDLTFSLMKTNKWYVTKNPENERICYSHKVNYKGFKILETKDNSYFNRNKKYTTVNLANGKIEVKIYKLIEE